MFLPINNQTMAEKLKPVAAAHRTTHSYIKSELALPLRDTRTSIHTPDHPQYPTLHHQIGIHQVSCSNFEEVVAQWLLTVCSLVPHLMAILYQSSALGSQSAATAGIAVRQVCKGSSFSHGETKSHCLSYLIDHLTIHFVYRWLSPSLAVSSPGLGQSSSVQQQL